MIYPIKKIRSNFPILKKNINNHKLIYLDNAASSQKPNYVINSQINFYKKQNAAVHRGIHTLSNEATSKMENIRKQIAKFINASSENEIIFVKGSTEGINLVANSWGRYNINSGDNIIITEMEHHSNIVPWQILSKEKNISIRYIPLLPNGKLNLKKLDILVDIRTRLLAITQLSNVLGTKNLIKEIIIKIRKKSQALVLVDGAQGIVHEKIDVQNIDCDFYVFSGHKLYGPTGIGVLYSKKSLLDSMLPWEGGGSMIKTVSLNKKTIFNDSPWKFEAGSPNIVGIIGLGAAISYIEKIGLNKIHYYEDKLMNYMFESLKQIPNIKIYGPSDRKGIISFNLNNYHAYDIGILLDQYGIAIRTGHHCAMPLMNYFKVTSMCRASIAMYNNKSDIDNLIFGLLKIKKLLS